MKHKMILRHARTGVSALGPPEVRPLRPADVPSILRIATRQRPSLIARYSSWWKSGRIGGLYVVTVGRRVAGFGCLSFSSPTEAWIEGLLVDKRLRGHGLGTALGEHLLAQAAVAGARVVRLSTAVTNAPMLHIYLDKLGFHPAGRWLRIFRLAPTALNDWPAPAAGSVTSAEAWQFVASSPTYQAAHHLWTAPEDFTVQTELTEPQLRRLISLGACIAIRRRGTLCGLGALGPPGQRNAPQGSLRLLHIAAADASAFRAVLARAARIARERDLTLALMIPVPSDAVRRRLIRLARDSGARWTELVVLEKWLVE